MTLVITDSARVFIRPALLAIIVGLAGASACAPRARRAPRAPLPDAMSMPAVCDSAPPPLAAGAQHRAVRVPQVARATGRGTVVGTIVEAGSGQPLSYGEASLHRVATDSAVGRPVGRPVMADSLGGFALTDLAPGAYTLRVRAISHRFEEHPVAVRAGAVDTVRVEMRYYSCHGY